VDLGAAESAKARIAALRERARERERAAKSAIIELAQVDRVVLDVALLNHLQHVRPDGGMQLLVLVHLLGT
jgi:hypothetical protein